MRILVDNIYSILQPEEDDIPEILAKIKKNFSVYAPGFQYSKAYKAFKKTRGMTGWDGKVNLFVHGKILTGLLPDAIEICNKSKVQVDIIDRRIIHQVTPKPWSVDLRDYQFQAIKKAIENTYLGRWWPRGIIHIATGGGKTEVAAAMLQMIDLPSVFIVHRKDLLHQAVQRFSKYGLPVGVCGDGEWSPDKITVATFQTILARLKNKQDLTFLRQAEQVFYDEAHHIAASSQKGNTFVQLSSLMPNAFMRWGLTATPFMKDKYSNLLLKGVAGDVLYSLKNEALIDKGFLAKPTVYMIRSRGREGIPNVWPDCYEQGIVFNEERNNKIAEEVKLGTPPILVLVERIEHGVIIQKKTGIPFISGEDPTETRNKITEELRRGKHKAVIATTIYDEGIDIPELRTLIIASGGKSPIRGRQRVGRGLRLSEGKTTVKIIDFMDWSSKILHAHSRQRLTNWKEEGFEVVELGSNENTPK